MRLGILKNMLRKFVIYVLPRLGMDEIGSHVCMLTPMALRRLAKRELNIECFIDVGASNGRWSLEAMQYWPEAHYHLIEANPCHQEMIKRVSGHNPNFSYTFAAAGDAVGKISFDTSNPFGGSAKHGPISGGDFAEVAMTTIDQAVKENGLKPPYCIKLDTHGFEVAILNGAVETFKDTSLLVIETYNFRLGPEGLMFYEMCALLEKLGFRVVDISEPLWRPNDKVLWQLDLLFINENSREFSQGHYF